VSGRSLEDPDELLPDDLVFPLLIHYPGQRGQEPLPGGDGDQTGPRPWGTRFAVPAVVEAKHRKRRTHGVIKKETKYIDDGKEHTDSIDEPYEDEVDE
jgi:hypothetical protein